MPVPPATTPSTTPPATSIAPATTPHAVPHVDARRVAALRAFTRFYTAVLGVLDEGLLHTPYSVTEARILFELAQQDDVPVADLRRDLRVDAGYMSRITARLEADGLVTRRRDGADARRQVLRLTDQGRAVFATLDARAAEQAARLLGALDEPAQRQVVAAMDTIRGALGEERPASPRAVVLRAPGPGDLGWIVARHGALYAAEYGWDTTFEGLVARIVGDFTAGHDPQREAAWIAEVDGEPAGCVFCVARDETTAQLRLLLVEPSARGLGIGSRLVDECLRFAARAGYTSITLWTNDVLVSARRIYEAAGFTLVDAEPHHSFGHDLVGQHWARAL
ncbi:MAG TPA: bifunctional helix-turn-helix transcriptional regulator/GNAT family N-acetyltransferase [Acidimicrobiales bacterium]|nr:bifunctional helix-turn-helix transcriptional regulator/GNAT family N-acetyltransferase [Acidimicrobiales bacterium]